MLSMGGLYRGCTGAAQELYMVLQVPSRGERPALQTCTHNAGMVLLWALGIVQY